MLEVGCGDGAYALAAAAAGARVTGLDASPAAVETARRRAAEAGLDVALQVAPAGRLPFEAERFDVVPAATVLCFVADPASAVAEMARVLRPGGLVVLGELGRWSMWAAWRRLRGWRGAATWRGARFRTVRELRALMLKAGLKPGPFRGAAFYPPIGAVARLVAPIDGFLGRWMTLGAAFVAITGGKASRG